MVSACFLPGVCITLHLNRAALRLIRSPIFFFPLLSGNHRCPLHNPRPTEGANPPFNPRPRLATPCCSFFHPLHHLIPPFRSPHEAVPAEPPVTHEVPRIVNALVYQHGRKAVHCCARLGGFGTGRAGHLATQPNLDPLPQTAYSCGVLDGPSPTQYDRPLHV
ncbi:hypothetical protein M427DRAFT_138163 [Gonapodya prolifera JEL478]|uniref:Uncharacterized protein n=1 Tax=Gonapodya prolifera (strain JEL478) TaxID=1344416 RepID=A0A139A465_GONPJ|nr:hypothetical protein M427DRAFT_138163 [Gonapodya prolifera JEL478]|eukprot:KXS11580.1 hypothetical protein M427DRAFT_138163 [Gonapodya prolifera JEL478]